MVATQSFLERLGGELDAAREAGTFKTERLITGPQGSHIAVADGGDVLNFCANNYLGLSSHPDLITAAHEALDSYGYGLSSVRFICGTQTPHRELEQRLASWLGYDDAILYTSCFDANGGVFETLLGPEDAVISDALNHASIIDGIRLCKAQRHRYAHDDLDDLKRCLEQAAGARTRMVVTDGVFSMDGDIARLAEICDVAEAHDALVLVDDSHATGFLGDGGRGSIEHCGVMGRVTVLTSTLGKALGGASGGFTAGPQAAIDMLRQRSRPYLFSNSVAPMIVGATLKALELVSGSDELRGRLRANTERFRAGMTAAGFDIRPGVHPIVPVMLGDARLASAIAADMLAEGIYVIGFSFPVVPKGQARIRVQLSAGHSEDDVERALAAFAKVGKAHGVIG
jgi:glycine C-acetyltransferase